jgi:hypothetical protein
MNNLALPVQQSVQQPIYQYPPHPQHTDMPMHPYQHMTQMPMHQQMPQMPRHQHQMPTKYRNQMQARMSPPQQQPPAQQRQVTPQQAATQHMTPDRQNTQQQGEPTPDNRTAGLKTTGLSPHAKRTNTDVERKEPDAKRRDDKETLTKKDTRMHLLIHQTCSTNK